MSTPTDARFAAADAALESIDERLRKARIHARLFGGSSAVHIGRYAIAERLGKGAMGTVFRAWDTHLEREVAIKVLADRGADAQTRMLREARALAQLSHPNVVTIFEAGIDGERVFLVMEYLDGARLNDWQTGRSLDAVLDAYCAAGRGLTAVHAAGLVHRDFKPTNVMVDAQAQVQLIDFGLVGGPGGGGGVVRARPVHAETTGLLGTPAYMAPEQMTGQRASTRSDQFAFCASLYEALAGCRPFAGDSAADRARRIQAGELAHMRPIPKALRTILQRGLHADPAARWPSMAALLDAIAKTRRRPPWVGVALGLTVLAGAALALWPTDRIEPPAQRPEVGVTTRALPAAPALRAAVLAARGADDGWRRAARTLLDGPIVERILPRPPSGLPVEIFEVVPGRHWARLVDGRELWYDGSRWSTFGPRRLQGWAARACWLDGRPRLVDWLPPRADGEAHWMYCEADTLTVIGPRTVERWSWEGTPRGRFDVPEGSHSRLGASVLTHTASGVLHRQALATGAARAVPRELDRVRQLTSNGEMAAVLHEDGRLLIWNGAEPPRTLATQPDHRGRLLITHDSRWVGHLVDGRLTIWPTTRGVEPIEVPGRWQTAYTGFSARFVVMKAADGLPAAFDTQTRRLVSLPHDGLLWALAADAERFYTSGLDGRTRVWSITSWVGQTIGRHGARLWSGATTADRRRWATTSVDGTVHVWSLDAPPRILRGHTATVFTAVFSPDETRLATASRDGSARIWSLTDPAVAPVILPGHEGWAYALAFSPDGRWLATSSKSGVIRLWSVDGGPAKVLGHHRDNGIRRVHSVAFSPDGRFVFSACKGGRVRRWSVADATLRELPRHMASANVMRTARDQLVTYGAQTIRVFDGAGEIHRATWSVPGGVQAIQPSPDGRLITVSRPDGVVELLDVDAPDARRVLGTVDGPPEMLAFDQQGQRIIAGTWTGQIGVWTLADGAFQALGGHTAGVRFVGFDANGDALSGGGPEGKVRRWPLGSSDSALRARLDAASQTCLSTADAARWLAPEERTRARICP